MSDATKNNFKLRTQVRRKIYSIRRFFLTPAKGCLGYRTSKANLSGFKMLKY